MLHSLRDKKSLPRRNDSALDPGEIARLRETIDTLAQVVGRQHQLVASLAQVVRNPLALIFGPAEWLARLEEEPDLDQLQQQGRMLHRNALCIQRLIEYAQHHAHVDRIALGSQQQTVDVVEVLRDVLQPHMARIAQRRLRLSTLNDVSEIFVELDVEKLQLALHLLIGRAIEEAPDGGNVLVKAGILPREDPYHVEVCIKHTGSMQDDTSNEDNADPALRLESVIKEPVAFWNDLAVVKKLVRALGGDLRLQVEAGFSTEYVVRLPLQGAVPLPLALAPYEQIAQDGFEELPDDESNELRDPYWSIKREEASPHEKESPIALVVDDNPDFRFYLRSCLSRHYVVEEAANGRDALEKAREIVPDVIVSDVTMPHVDGHAFCRQIRADEALNHIPVVLIGALSEPEHRVQGLEAGADSYLVKPFDSKILLAQVKSLMASRRRLRRHYSQQVLIEPLDITVPSVDQVFLEEVQIAVEQHMGDELFNLNAFADAVNMAPRQLQRKFKSVLGMSPMEYVRVLRLKRAAQLLDQDAGNVSQIAFQVGFSNPRHFTRSFTKFFGQSPTEYRNAE